MDLCYKIFINYKYKLIFRFQATYWNFYKIIRFMTLIYVWIIKINFILIKVWLFHFISIKNFIIKLIKYNEL